MAPSTDTLRDIGKEEVHFFLSRVSKRKIYTTTLLSILLVLTLAQPHLPFLLLVFAIPFLAWLTWSAYVIVRRPYARVAQTICILIWLVAVMIIVMTHTIGHKMARRDANDIVRKIQFHQFRFNRCPENLEGLLMPHPQLVRRFKADFTYECKGRKPSLSYAVTYTVLDRYEYDFENLRWRYLSWARKKYFASPEDPVPQPFPDTPEAADEETAPPVNGQARRHRR
jgi:hypothetical protein